MFDTPYVMQMAQTLARHAGARQAQIAKNIANADTPGYRAQDLKPFSESFRESGMKATRVQHMQMPGSTDAFRTVKVPGATSPNGNNVSLEEEMVRASDAKSAHDMALTVYKSSLDVLRASLGRGR